MGQTISGIALSCWGRVMYWCCMVMGLVSASALVGHSQEQIPSKYQTRAVWLTTNYGLDWPKQPAADQAGELRQQRELVQLLDGLQRIGINTVYLQVRSQGQLIYPSRFEPISTYITSRSALGYDPLAFAITEIHRRGMSVHAWYSVLPIGKRLPASARRGAGQNGYDAVRHRGYYYMDPTSERTIAFVRDEIRDLVNRYDVDGVHLDYIRYPDRSDGFPDEMVHRESATGAKLADWRRANISNIVRAIYHEVKSCDSTVVVSAATIGAYAPLPGYRLGWNARDAVYQDPVAWVQGGYLDYIVPMHYTRGESFEPVIHDWIHRVGERLVIGLGAYRILPHEGEWSPAEVLDQTQCTQLYTEVSGVAYFRAEQLIHSGRLTQLGELVADQLAAHPVLPPCYAAITPAASVSPPMDIEATVVGDQLVLHWTGHTGGTLLYAVYARRGGETPDTAEHTRDLVAVTPDTTVVLPLAQLLRAHEDDMLILELSSYDWRTGTESFSLSGAAYMQLVEPSDAAVAPTQER